MCMLRQGCFLSMLHRTCEKLHEGVRLGGLGMSNTLDITSYFKPRCIKKYSIPYIMYIELSYISINGEVVNSNIY